MNPIKSLELKNQLQSLFKAFQVSNLSGDETEFENNIKALIGKVSYTEEGFSKDEIEKQRDLTLKFHWGHDHDFGTFQMKGRMGDRHIQLITNFITFFNLDLSFFNKKDIFDIGCWTGGTTLILNMLQANSVLSIEEVKKYADTTKYLIDSFNLNEKVSVENRSLYSCNTEYFHEKFDIVYFPGVLYHLSDPLIALRILYNSLKPGGHIFIETAGIKNPNNVFQYKGPDAINNGTKGELNRGGWNWFIPSETALTKITEDAGFQNIQTYYLDSGSRIYAFAQKVGFTPICKSGLSIIDIK